MDAFGLAAIASCGIILLFAFVDWLTSRNWGPFTLRDVGHRVFGTRRRAIAAYEAMLLVLLFWVLPMLWIQTAHAQVGVVLVVLMSAPAFTFVVVRRRFKTTGRKDAEPGEMLELTIEHNYRNGHLDGMVSTLLDKIKKLDPDDVVVKEYMHAKQRLLSRDDEVGQAFRDALKRLELGQEQED